MILNRHGPAVVEFPTDLEILVTREFAAPIELVFDVFTKPEHVRKTFAPYGEEVKECSIDLRVGGNYRLVFVTGDGRECAFSGTFLEVDRPTPNCPDMVVRRVASCARRRIYGFAGDARRDEGRV